MVNFIFGLLRDWWRTPDHAELLFWCCGYLVIGNGRYILLAAICGCRAVVSSRRVGWVEGEENTIFLCPWKVSINGSAWLDGVCYLWSSGCWRNAVSHRKGTTLIYFCQGLGMPILPRLNWLFILIFFSLFKDSALPGVPLLPASFPSKNREWQSPYPSLRFFPTHPSGRGIFQLSFSPLVSFQKEKEEKMRISSERRTIIFFITIFSELSSF